MKEDLTEVSLGEWTYRVMKGVVFSSVLLFSAVLVAMLFK